MRDFSVTEHDIAASKARWEPKFLAFAERSTQLLTSTRRLPIFAEAVRLATAWLDANVIENRHNFPDRSLLLIGDEHLATAAADLLDPAGIFYTHIFPNAWIHWHDTEFRGSPGWWCATHWAVNNPERLLHFAQFEYLDVGLRPNEIYLLSTASGSRGTDSLCWLVEGKLHVDAPFCEWVDS